MGLSLSGATDLEAHGASAAHLATLADDLATLLLIAGLRLGYGGTLDHGGTRTAGTNYTTRLFGLVRSYSPLTASGAGRIHPIENFVAWPRHLAFGDAELAQYGQEARLRRIPRPGDLCVTNAELGADPRGAFPPDSPIRRWAYARGLTAMREDMTLQINARIALAGKLTGYSGLLPGVLEEILLARTRPAKRPVYLLGAFGGAARLAIDLIEQRTRAEATTAWVTHQVTDHATLADEYRRRNDRFTTPEDAAAALRALGLAGPAAALDNGLDDAHNRELFSATDSHRIVELILTGLRRRFSRS